MNTDARMRRRAVAVGAGVVLGVFLCVGCFKRGESGGDVSVGRGGAAPAGKEAPLEARVEAALRKGAEYLMSVMGEEGAVEISVPQAGGKKVPSAGITALAVVALTKVPGDDPRVKEAVEKGVRYLVSLQKPDGGIYLDAKAAPPTYVTAVTLMALSAAGREKYAEVIRKAQAYLAGKQAGDASDKTNYGGIGYGSDGTANLSTTQFALEALRESGYADTEVFKRAIVFLQRCQNSSETNDLGVAGDDGGFYYSTHASKAGEVTLPGGRKGYKSYGSMTYAGVKSYIYAGLTKDDPRVRNALKWIRAHYTVDANPGMDNPTMGLYYYYHTMAKTLAVLEMDTVEDAAGVKHDWRKDLAGKLMGLQQADGSWINKESRWFESIKPLATSYAVIALSYCRKNK